MRLAVQNYLAHKTFPCNKFDLTFCHLFFKNEINGQYKKHETNKVVPAKCFGSEEDKCKNRKHHQRYYLLNYF